MKYYVFKRNKKTKRKTVSREVETIEEARELCKEANLNDLNCWWEFTSDIEYTKN